MTQRIRDLPSLGPASEKQLAEIGVKTVAQLRKLGPVKAFHALRFRYGKRITLNYLWALECGLKDMDWRDLPAARKADLKLEVAALEAKQTK